MCVQGADPGAWQAEGFTFQIQMWPLRQSSGMHNQLSRPNKRALVATGGEKKGKREGKKKRQEFVLVNISFSDFPSLHFILELQGERKEN